MSVRRTKIQGDLRAQRRMPVCSHTCEHTLPGQGWGEPGAGEGLSLVRGGPGCWVVWFFKAIPDWMGLA